ncbi:MAG: hypothetical protein AAGC95_17175 [Pseudomonadota bacterium]
MSVKTFLTAYYKQIDDGLLSQLVDELKKMHASSRRRGDPTRFRYNKLRESAQKIIRDNASISDLFDGDSGQLALFAINSRTFTLGDGEFIENGQFSSWSNDIGRPEILHRIDESVAGLFVAPEFREKFGYKYIESQVPALFGPRTEEMTLANNIFRVHTDNDFVSEEFSKRIVRKGWMNWVGDGQRTTFMRAVFGSVRSIDFWESDYAAKYISQLSDEFEAARSFARNSEKSVEEFMDQFYSLVTSLKVASEAYGIASKGAGN